LKGNPIDFKAKAWKGILHIVGQLEVKEGKIEEDNNSNSNNRESNSINNNNISLLKVSREPTSDAKEEEEFPIQSIDDYSDASNK